MAPPSTSTECVRLEFDDGSGKDFATPADALFEICYGRDGQGLRGVTGLRRVTHADAEAMVLDGQPVLNHTLPEEGEVIWDREKLEELVAAAHADPATPPLRGEPDETTFPALVENVVDVDQIAAAAARGEA